MPTPGVLEGTVELRCWTEARDLCVEVLDRGTWREPPPGNPGPRVGFPMMHRLVPALVVRHDTHGTLCAAPLAARPPSRARSIPCSAPRAAQQYDTC